jgi:hypothetical protein
MGDNPDNRRRNAHVFITIDRRSSVRTHIAATRWCRVRSPRHASSSTSLLALPWSF